MEIRDQDRLRVSYELTGEEDPEAKAREIAIEQTAELPADCFSPEIDRRVVGRVEEMERLDRSRHRVTISYSAGLAAGELPQLLVVLLGNLSMYRGIRIVDVGWPDELLEALPGPALGVPGLRFRLPGTEGRPLFCAALKPVGLSTAELADLCLALARGGADLITDDQGLADQDTAPFEERIRACVEAVERARDETGHRSLYLPHLTGPVESLEPRLTLLKEIGISGALICPFVTGLDTLRWLAERSGLFLMAHPAASGWYWQGNPSVAPEVILGDLLRIAGADGVIFPNPGARFPFSEEDALALVDRLRRPLGGLRPSFPVPGGGIQVETLDHWSRRYGPDTVFLIGGSLFQQGEVEEETRKLISGLRELS
ncbi:MAG: RuBisCO large subunit C-terminal-like domain-containing protein [Thermoanaerobaculia bacterium]|nr:RuBisCO large subunit C-terminal-like domain-containing protein [Thermoanaerobaculia bacterium]